jgi:hypothetical protein
MATRSRTTFKKRQKELARLEKQRDKAARRMQRKLDKSMGIAAGGFIEEIVEEPDDIPEVDDEASEVHPENPPSGLA